MYAAHEVAPDAEIERTMPATGEEIHTKRQLSLRRSFREGPLGRARNL